MPIMISEVYDAFLDAGASEEKARKAAEALSNYENRFNKVDLELAMIHGKITLLQWMLGFNLVFTVGILWKVLA